MSACTDTLTHMAVQLNVFLRVNPSLVHFEIGTHATAHHRLRTQAQMHDCYWSSSRVHGEGGDRERGS